MITKFSNDNILSIVIWVRFYLFQNNFYQQGTRGLTVSVSAHRVLFRFNKEILDISEMHELSELWEILELSGVLDISDILEFS